MANEKDKRVQVRMADLEGPLKALWDFLPSLKSAPKSASLLALCDFGQKYIEQQQASNQTATTTNKDTLKNDTNNDISTQSDTGTDVYALSDESPEQYTDLGGTDPNDEF